MSFVSLCYHYIRDAEGRALFPRIWGNSEDQLREHIQALYDLYRPLSLDDVRALFSRGTGEVNHGRTGILFTFDDGLSDHYRAAKILSEYGIRGVFFVPTCVLRDSLPANPQIIHYTLAHYGVERFLAVYDEALKNENIVDAVHPRLSRGSNAITTIANIKKTFKYSIPPEIARRILITVYEHLLKRDFPDILESMHLTHSQLEDMIRMGHSIGAHTHTHISIAAHKMDVEQFRKEIIEPREWLASTYDTVVDSLSYPFGGKQDCLEAKELLSATKDYQFAFTVENVLNDSSSDPYALGRYEPWPEDDASTLLKKLAKMH